MYDFVSKTKRVINKLIEGGNLEVANTNPKRALYSFLVPIFFSIFCLTLNGFIDSIFVAECGSLSLVAVGIIQSIFIIVNALGTGLSIAATSYLSFAMGKSDDKDKLHRIISNIILVTFICGIISSILLCLFLDPILTYLNIYGAYEFALTYGYVVFMGNIFFFSNAVFPGILKAGGDVVKSSAAMIVTSLTNVVFDYYLIHVLGWGVFGAGIATVFCSFLCALIMLNNILENEKFKYKLSHMLNVDFGLMKKIILYALPVAVENGVLSIYVFIVSMIFNIFTSTMDLAIFIALFNIIKLALIPTIAISEANVPLSSYFYGSKSYDKIKSLIKYELKVAVGLAIVIWIVLVILNGVLAGVYGTSLLFIRKFTNILPFYMIILIFMPLGNIGVSLLQSLQKYNVSLLLTFVKSILIEIIFAGLGYYIFRNLFGIYLGLIIGSILGCVLVLMISYRIFNKIEKDSKIMEVQNVS